MGTRCHLQTRQVRAGAGLDLPAGAGLSAEVRKTDRERQVPSRLPLCRMVTSSFKRVVGPTQGPVCSEVHVFWKG